MSAHLTHQLSTSQNQLVKLILDMAPKWDRKSARCLDWETLFYIPFHYSKTLFAVMIRTSLWGRINYPVFDTNKAVHGGGGYNKFKCLRIGHLSVNHLVLCFVGFCPNRWFWYGQARAFVWRDVLDWLLQRTLIHIIDIGMVDVPYVFACDTTLSGANLSVQSHLGFKLSKTNFKRQIAQAYRDLSTFPHSSQINLVCNGFRGLIAWSVLISCFALKWRRKFELELLVGDSISYTTVQKRDLIINNYSNYLISM